jgi:hypothetical protein
VAGAASLGRLVRFFCIAPFAAYVVAIFILGRGGPSRIRLPDKSCRHAIEHSVSYIFEALAHKVFEPFYCTVKTKHTLFE